MNRPEAGRGQGLERYAGLPTLPAQKGDASRARPYLRPFQLFVRLLVSLLFNVRVRGLENLPPGRKIVVANHMSWLDPFLVLVYFPLEPRIYVLADHHAVGRTGFRARMMEMLQVVVTLDPGKARSALDEMEDLLGRGGSLLVFPEAAPEAHPREGALRELFHGASYLSVQSGVPLVPVGITGTSELWLRRRVVVRVGRPIYPVGIEGGRREQVRALTARISRDIKALLPGDRQRARFKPLRKWLTDLFA